MSYSILWKIFTHSHSKERRNPQPNSCYHSNTHTQKAKQSNNIHASSSNPWKICIDFQSKKLSTLRAIQTLKSLLLTTALIQKNNIMIFLTLFKIKSVTISSTLNTSYTIFKCREKRVFKIRFVLVFM